MAAILLTLFSRFLTMKTAVLASLVGSAAAFAPASTGKINT